MVKKRKNLDWERIERDYRAGWLSIREIARQHGCSDTAIRKRMKKLGVTQDLSKKVSAKVGDGLVRADIVFSTPSTSIGR